MEVPEIALETYRLWSTRALDEAALHRIQADLLAIDDLSKLYTTVTALAATALFFEQRGDLAAKDRLLELIKSEAPRLHFAEAFDTEAIAEAVALRLEKLAGPKTIAPRPPRPPSVKALVPNPALRPPPSKKQ
jgi:hypothetical protein